MTLKMVKSLISYLNNYKMLTFICDINLVFCPNNITFARKFNKYVFKNGKQDLQAYDGDVGAPIR